MNTRRVLLVGRDYFFYTREIANELSRSLGAEVDYVPIAPETAWYSAMKRIPALSRSWLAHHHRGVLERLAGRTFDQVIFIQCHQLGHELVEAYRSAFAGARFKLYYWDSLRTHDYRPFLDYFDEAFSFDPVDVASEPRLQLLPLFFAERFRALRSRTEFDHDLVFVGTAMSPRRYDQVQRFRAWARDEGVRMYDYLYVSPAFYLRTLLRGRRLRGVHFRTLSGAEVHDAYARSRAILDLPDNIQSGLAMRTFESLGAHRKLVTTQRRVANEDFFDARSVFVIGLHGDFPTAQFLASEVHPAAVIEAYSLAQWTARLTGWTRADDADSISEPG